MDLLTHYIARGAQPWNVSTEAAWLDYELRAWIGPRLVRRKPRRVCNIGIGTGLWDDWLGHLIDRRAVLTSVDPDPEACQLFALRQLHERHPHPAQIVCGDVADGCLAGSAFDAITIVGSALAEAPDRLAIETALLDALAPGGVLLIGAVLLAGAPIPAGAEQRWLGDIVVALRELIR